MHYSKWDTLIENFFEEVNWNDFFSFDQRFWSTRVQPMQLKLSYLRRLTFYLRVVFMLNVKFLREGATLAHERPNYVHAGGYIYALGGKILPSKKIFHYRRA